MVTTLTGGDRIILILSPNFSMSWKLNLYLLLGISLWILLIGLGFWIAGAWPVVPFLGLEIIFLAAALWYTHRKLRHREVLSISEDQVVYEQGVRFPQSRVQWRRDSVRGQVLRIGHPLQSPEIALFDADGRHCRIGAFLNKADSDLLIVLLRKQGIHLRTDNELIRRSF